MAIKAEVVSAISFVHYQERQTVWRVTFLNDFQDTSGVSVRFWLLGEAMRNCIEVAAWLIISKLAVML